MTGDRWHSFLPAVPLPKTHPCWWGLAWGGWLLPVALGLSRGWRSLSVYAGSCLTPPIRCRVVSLRAALFHDIRGFMTYEQPRPRIAGPTCGRDHAQVRALGGARARSATPVPACSPRRLMMKPGSIFDDFWGCHTDESVRLLRCLRHRPHPTRATDKPSPTVTATPDDRP